MLQKEGLAAISIIKLTLAMLPTLTNPLANICMFGSRNVLRIIISCRLVQTYTQGSFSHVVGIYVWLGRGGGKRGVYKGKKVM